MFAHQRQVVHGGHDGNAAFHQAAQQGHHFDLPSQIQVLSWFVEQHKLRCLRQRDGNLHPLTFAAGELGKDAMAHAEDIDGLHRALHRVEIFTAKTTEKAEMRNPSLGNNFFHAEGEGYVEVLWHQSDAAGELDGAATLLNSLPCTSTSPAEGASSAAASFSSVVLPEPLGPSRAKVSPGCTGKLSSLKTVRAP